MHIVADRRPSKGNQFLVMYYICIERDLANVRLGVREMFEDIENSIGCLGEGRLTRVNHVDKFSIRS